MAVETVSAESTTTGADSFIHLRKQAATERAARRTQLPLSEQVLIVREHLEQAHGLVEMLRALLTHEEDCWPGVDRIAKTIELALFNAQEPYDLVMSLGTDSPLSPLLAGRVDHAPAVLSCIDAWLWAEEWTFVPSPTVVEASLRAVSASLKDCIDVLIDFEGRASSTADQAITH